MKQFLLMLTAVAIVFAACTKSDDSKSADEILLTGKWRVTGYNVKYPLSTTLDTVVDLYKVMDTCRFDDYITFDHNYKGVQHAGPKKCNTESDEVTFEWKLENNNTHLTINNAQYTFGNTKSYPPVGGLEYINATIKKINAATFTVTYQYVVQTAPSVPSKTYFYTQTFSRY